jgi:RNA recognition motif-containing protein
LDPARVGKTNQNQARFARASGMVLNSNDSGKEWFNVKIYVGNLSFNTNDEALSTLFKQYGAVESAKVVTDRETGRSRGFGFVEMADDGEARKAIEATNGVEIDGRTLTVNEARPQEKRSGGGGGGRGGGRGGDFGGGGGRGRRY